MGRIVVTEFVSLDGVKEAPGGGADFKHAGWTFKIDRGKQGDMFSENGRSASPSMPSWLSCSHYSGYFPWSWG